jgi:hypothetical protein
MSNKPQFLLLLFLVVVTASAAIYKWVDEKGVTHYSETPPSNQKSQKVQLPAITSPTTTMDNNLSNRIRQEKNENPENITPNTDSGGLREEERCIEARKQLAMLQLQRPVYRDKEGKLHARWKYDTYKGEREYLSDAARPAEIERVRQEILASCQNPDDANAQELVRKEWVKSEYCVAARADLEALERPEAKTTQQELREKRQEVDKYCKE